MANRTAKCMYLTEIPIGFGLANIAGRCSWSPVSNPANRN